MGIKRSGKAGKSAKQTSRYWGIAPAEPTITSVTRTGVSYLSGSYSIAFQPGVSTGSAATSYTITATNVNYGDRVFTATSSPYQVTGLRAGANWTFKIKANATVGQSQTVSTSTELVGPTQDITTVPDAPTAPVASSPSGTSYDTVTWVAPDNGGLAITEYQWESSDSKTGTTSSLTVNVPQEAGTSQTYRVRAKNANGYSEWSGSSSGVTTFSFVPFNAFNNFSPFNNFNNFVAFNNFNNFVAFNNFGPFNNFNNFVAFNNFNNFVAFNNFNNFSAFGPFNNFVPFGPFTAFGAFNNFSAFGFYGGCVEANTLVATIGADNEILFIPAKDVTVGMDVWSPGFDELQDETDMDPFLWTSSQITNFNIGATKVTNVVESTKTSAMTINGLQSKKYSLEQSMMVKRNDQIGFVVSGQLAVGDILYVPNFETKEVEELPVTSIEIIEGEHQVYMFNMEPGDLFIAGNLVLHNYKAYY